MLTFAHPISAPTSAASSSADSLFAAGGQDRLLNIPQSISLAGNPISNAAFLFLSTSDSPSIAASSTTVVISSASSTEVGQNSRVDSIVGSATLTTSAGFFSFLTVQFAAKVTRGSTAPSAATFQAAGSIFATETPA